MITKTKLGRVSAIALLALAYPVANQAMAQEGTAQAAQEVNDGASRRLSTVTVTANKREENLQNVPIAINAITGDSLEKSGVLETSDLAGQVSNLQISSPFGRTQPNFILRGISVANEFNSNQASPNGVYLDEVYLSSRFAQGMNLFDLDRVEVIKGPQGTLFGRNTVGGAINIITKKADFNGSNGFASAGIGNFNTYKASGAYGSEIIDDTLAFRVAGAIEKGDGQIDNPVTGVGKGRTTDNYALRGSLLWEPSDSTRFTLRAYAGQSDASSEPPLSIGALPDGSNPITGYSRDGLDYWESAVDYQGGNKTKAQGVALISTFDVGDFELTSITSYDDGELRVDQDPDGSPVDVFAINWYSDYDQFSQDVRLSSNPDANFRYILGAYYGKDTNETFNTYRFFGFLENIPGLPAFDPPNIFVAPPYPGLLGGVTGVFSGFGVNHDFTQERTSTAIYGDANFDLSDKLTLTAGLRYTWDDIELSNVSSTAFDYSGTEQVTLIPPFAAPGSICPGSVGCPADLSDDSEQLTGRLILDYQMNDDLMFYGSYSRGYRAGAINGTAYASPSQLTFVEPEKVDAYEIGFKGDFSDGTIRLNGSLFYYDYQNQQLQEVIGIVPFLRNAPKAEALGFELDLQTQLTENLFASAGYGYLDSEYKELSLSGVDLAGNTFSNAPDQTFNAFADWTAYSNQVGELHIRPSAVYAGDAWLSPFNEKPSSSANAVGDNSNLYQEGYWLVNGRMAWETDQWTVAASVRNIFDEEYYAYGLDLRAAVGVDFLIRGQRRTYGLDVTYKF